MTRLSKRVSGLEESPTLAITAEAKALKAKGHDIINFGAGEPDFDTPPNIKEAAIRAIADGRTKYTPVGGIPELKDAIIEKFEQDNGLFYARDEILVSCGGKHSIYNLFQALFDQGDEVIILSPFWVSYPVMALLAGASPVFVHAGDEDSFKVSVDALRRHITPRTKAIVINSPSNPTGRAYTEKELSDMAGLALEKGLFIISDEIYEKLVYNGFKQVSVASLSKEARESAIVINGVSKTYSMTGWRIGYSAGPKELIKAMTNIQSQSTSNPTSISQWAALEALKGPQDSLEAMTREFERRRDAMVMGLNSIEGITCLKPDGAFYAFPNVSGLYGDVVKGSAGLARHLLDKAGVAIVPGEPFGSDAHIRLSYACSMEDITNGVERIKKAIEGLR